MSTLGGWAGHERRKAKRNDPDCSGSAVRCRSRARRPGVHPPLHEILKNYLMWDSISLFTDGRRPPTRSPVHLTPLAQAYPSPRAPELTCPSPELTCPSPELTCPSPELTCPSPEVMTGTDMPESGSDMPWHEEPAPASRLDCCIAVGSAGQPTRPSTRFPVRLLTRAIRPPAHPGPGRGPPGGIDRPARRHDQVIWW